MILAISATPLGLSCGVEDSNPANSPEAQYYCSEPLKIVVFRDQTASGLRNRTPALRADDLDSLSMRIKKCGGELSVGIIDARSNASLVRLFVPQPEPLPAVPDSQGNVFKVDRTLRTYQDALRRFNARDAQRLTTAEQRLQIFKQRADSLLRAPAETMHTSVFAAVARAAYYLDEPTAWRTPPRKISVLISDVINNVPGPRVPLPKGTELIIVNGEPTLGSLADYSPLRFEALDAAIRYITANPPSTATNAYNAAVASKDR